MILSGEVLVEFRSFERSGYWPFCSAINISLLTEWNMIFRGPLPTAVIRQAPGWSHLTTFIPKTQDQTTIRHSTAFPLTSIRPAAQTAPSNRATATASAATSQFVLNATMRQAIACLSTSVDKNAASILP